MTENIMDDEDEKIRRNLVFVSAIILLCTWLNLEPKFIIEKLLSEEAASIVVTWRLWTAILILLIYFGMRYRFSTTLTTGLRNLRQELDGFNYRLSTLSLQAEVKKFSKSKKDSDAPSFTTPLTKAIADNQRHNISKYTVKNIDHVGIRDRDNGNVFKGTASFQIAYESDSTIKHAYPTAEFNISYAKRLIIQTRSCIRLLLYSNASTALITPIILLYLALCLTVFRLSQSLV